MNVYYATFGVGTPKSHLQQPIEALNKEEAREIMFEIYGYDWGFICKESQRKENLPMLTARKPV